LIFSARRPARVASVTPCEINLDGERLSLTLRRSARRTLALTIDHRGVRVAAPFDAPVREIERFVRTHGDWLRARINAHVPPETLAAVAGAVFPVLGEPVRLREHCGGRQARWQLDGEGEGASESESGAQELHLPREASAGALTRALGARALAWHRERVAEYCQRLDLKVPPVYLTSARTRWGSCSRLSGIRLHWRLIHLPPALINYVVAHEVAHLIEMNHSAKFWAVVEQLYPDWQSARRQLRAAAASLPVIVDVDRETSPR
jgi:predicted metal-dependent hydrolase